MNNPPVPSRGRDTLQTTIVPFSAEEFRTTAELLSKKLGSEYIAQRQGGGGKVPYLEAHKAINLANEVFGFNGWSSSVLDMTVDYFDVSDDQRISMGISALVRVTLRDGTFHEDIGYGSVENVRGKGSAFDKAKKEAVTDATKRALRIFGNALGLSLSDKEHMKNLGRNGQSNSTDGFYHPGTAALHRANESRKSMNDFGECDFPRSLTDDDTPGLQSGIVNRFRLTLFRITM
ncbi:hypothetical protein BJ742DRAFT_816600 [Cladochytrium replicatum]|nr:hypothetical protein BJ742DRAFT_816600 [Cladochytrium replicatum]